MNDKKLLGQFFTIANPFHNNAFYEWWNSIPEEKKRIIIEPFAGANNICCLINSILNNKPVWHCYDIQPNDINAFPDAKIEIRDTIADFPVGYSVGITNPPYLAKNSATRAKLPFPKTDYDDVYKLAINIMLRNLEYVAAIIPESFIKSGLFLDRLSAIVSLEYKMFNDTDCPVCLALFVPAGQKDEKISEDSFYLFRGNKQSIDYKSLKQKYSFNGKSADWKFNDPNGEIGIICIDNTKTASIRFVLGDEISSDKIKDTSRSLTRVSGLPDGINIADFIEKCNCFLRKFREETNDALLTSFKGLREDNRYRRRLDFANARMIMNTSISKSTYT